MKNRSPNPPGAHPRTPPGVESSLAAPTLLLVALFAFSGCPKLLGRATISLKDKAVTKIQAGASTQKATVCPGKPTQLKIVAHTADDRVFETCQVQSDGSTDRNENIEFHEFNFAPSAGHVDQNGFFNPPSDPFENFDKPYTIIVSLKQNPSIKSALVLNPDYSCTSLADWKGSAGRSGETGCDGFCGFWGGGGGGGTQQGSYGGDGSDGEDGSSGEDGLDGPHVSVSLAYVKSQCCGDLLVIRVQSKLYITTPDIDHPFIVDVSGGAGGTGGNGGFGGHGGDGGMGFHGGHGGDGGNGGSGGDGGNGGHGGTATVYVPEEHPEIGQYLHVVNEGGPGGGAGEGGSGGFSGYGGSSDTAISRGFNGHYGHDGYPGRDGNPGKPGPPITVVTAPLENLFGPELERGLPVY